MHHPLVRKHLVGRHLAHNYFYYLVVLFSSVFVVAEPTLADIPKNFTAVYKAKYSGISVTATRQLTTLPDGGQEFSFVAKSWLASIRESSQFHWSDENRIVPQLYNYERTGLGRNREAVLTFDWPNNRVTNNVQKKPWKMDVPDQALDKLSYQLQLRTDLINQKPLLEYNIADGGRLKQYNFEVIGEEKLDTKIGIFNTVKIRRLRDPGEERHTVFWMAKDWDYLVVRMQQEEDGKSYEIDITKATLDGEDVTGRK